MNEEEHPQSRQERVECHYPFVIACPETRSEESRTDNKKRPVVRPSASSKRKRIRLRKNRLLAGDPSRGHAARIFWQERRTGDDHLAGGRAQYAHHRLPSLINGGRRELRVRCGLRFLKALHYTIELALHGDLYVA